MFEPRYFRRHPPIRRAAPRRASQVARVTTWSLAVLLKKKKTYLIRFAFGKPSTWWPSLQRLASISIYQTDYGAHECDTAVWEEFSFLCACSLKIEENRLCTVANTFTTDCHDTRAVTGTQWSPTWWPPTSREYKREYKAPEGQPQHDTVAMEGFRSHLGGFPQV